MTKEEFTLALEKYQRKKQRQKWEYFGIGCLLLLVVFSPQGREFLSNESFEVPRDIVSILAGLCFGQFLNIKWFAEKENLLVAAKKLIESGGSQS